jgi:phosphoribosylglycinamide formyltransferase-1
VRDLVNLVVDLDGERFSPSSAFAARETLSQAGFALEERRSADDTTLAWIDAAFGGWWSSEAYASQNLIARRGGVPAGFASFDPQGLDFAWLRGGRVEPGTGVFGPFGVAAEERGGVLGAALLTLGLASLRERGFARAVIPAVGDEALVRYYAEHAGARAGATFSAAPFLERRARAVLMASGSGSNLQAVLDGCAAGALPLEVASVVCNNPRAYAIERARAAGVARVHVLPWQRKAGETRDAYDARLLETVAGERPDIVLLLGWMHLLDARFVDEMPALLNVHPAFLPLDPERDDVGMPDGMVIPAFRGPYAVRDALAAGSRWAGASVHHVTAKTDRGGVLVRAPLAIEEGESEEDVLTRLHPIEHALVARAIWRWTFERPGRPETAAAS